MRIRGTGIIALAAAATLAPAAGGAQAAVLDMEGFAPVNSATTENNANVAMGAYNLFIQHGHFFDSGNPNVGTLLADNGTDWLEVDTVNPITVSRIDGNAFSIQSFDATFYRLNYNTEPQWNRNIEVVGALNGGGSVSATFTVDNLDPFQTFSFGAGWTDLLSVSFTNPTVSPQTGPFGGSMGFDNIVVDAQSVSEPAMLGMFGLGLAGVALATRRRRR